MEHYFNRESKMPTYLLSRLPKLVGKVILIHLLQVIFMWMTSRFFSFYLIFANDNHIRIVNFKVVTTGREGGGGGMCVWRGSRDWNSIWKWKMHLFYCRFLAWGFVIYISGNFYLLKIYQKFWRENFHKNDFFFIWSWF